MRNDSYEEELVEVVVEVEAEVEAEDDSLTLAVGGGENREEQQIQIIHMNNGKNNGNHYNTLFKMYI